MKTKTFILASVAVFTLGVGSAMSGPCTTEIDGLTKTLTAKDAGSGPTPGASGQAPSAANPSNQHPPTAAMSQATQGQATSSEDVRRQTAGQPTAAQQGTTGTAAQHPPTAVMSEATQGQAAPATASQHPPTAAMSEATRSQAAPGPTGVGNPSDASIALGRARELDHQGKEAECMTAVQEAKQLAGPH